MSLNKKNKKQFARFVQFVAWQMVKTKLQSKKTIKIFNKMKNFLSKPKDYINEKQNIISKSKNKKLRKNYL